MSFWRCSISLCCTVPAFRLAPCDSFVISTPVQSRIVSFSMGNGCSVLAGSSTYSHPSSDEPSANQIAGGYSVKKSANGSTVCPRRMLSGGPPTCLNLKSKVSFEQNSPSWDSLSHRSQKTLTTIGASSLRGHTPISTLVSGSSVTPKVRKFVACSGRVSISVGHSTAMTTLFGTEPTASGFNVPAKTASGSIDSSISFWPLHFAQAANVSTRSLRLDQTRPRLAAPTDVLWPRAKPWPARTALVAPCLAACPMRASTSEPILPVYRTCRARCSFSPTLFRTSLRIPWKQRKSFGAIINSTSSPQRAFASSLYEPLMLEP